MEELAGSVLPVAAIPALVQPYLINARILSTAGSPARRRGWYLLRALLVLGLAVFSLTGTRLEAKDRVYKVRKGDCLEDIAAAYGFSAQALAKHNKLKDPSHLKVGQKLRIPTLSGNLRAVAAKPPTATPQPEAAALTASAEPERPGQTSQSSPAPNGGPAPAPPAVCYKELLSPRLKLALDTIQVTNARWKSIVIHHSAATNGSLAIIDHYHRVRGMENGMAYHFLIGNGHGMGDGQVAIGDRWVRQLDGGHLASEAMNRESIGICLVGDFDHEKPTPSQIHSLKAITAYLLNRCQLEPPAVKTHQQVNTRYTRCPGSNFPLKPLLAELGVLRLEPAHVAADAGADVTVLQGSR